jgi:hypothetical protein
MAEKNENSEENIDFPVTPSPYGIEAIDFEESYRAMNVGLRYVHETRNALERGVPEKWISDLADLLSSTAKKIREFELEHTDDTVLWRDDAGLPHEVLVRFQDEKRFDEVMGAYVKAEKQFEEYFKKHARAVTDEASRV